MNERPSLHEVINAYADAHAGDPGHNLDTGLPMDVPASPPTTDLAKFIFDTMTAANRALAEQYWKEPR